MDKKFKQIALIHYRNPNCVDVEEFLCDLERFVHTKRIIGRYFKGYSINIKLLINHLIIMSNLFQGNLNTLLLLYLNEEYYQIIVPFLVYLNHDIGDKIMIDNHLLKQIKAELQR